MRSYIPDYKVTTPATLDDALNLLHNNNDNLRILAGGTDIMVLLDSGNLNDKNILNISELNELRYISEDDDYCKIGALTTFTEIIENPFLCKYFPLLPKAARLTASRSIQNRGTIGGNIANGSPAADTPPVLLTYDAQIELVSKSGTRTIPYCDFHTGYKSSVLEHDEIIQGVTLFKNHTYNYDYMRKVGSRKSLAISKLILAGTASYRNSKFQDIKLSLGSVAATPIRLENTENTLRNRKVTKQLINSAVAQLKHEISPIDDIRSTQHYRTTVACNLLREFLEEIK